MNVLLNLILSMVAFGLVGIVGCHRSNSTSTADDSGHQTENEDTGFRDAGAPDAGYSPEERAAHYLSQMTLEEKIDYIGGDRSFFIRPIPRLDIPEVKSPPAKPGAYFL